MSSKIRTLWGNFDRSDFEWTAEKCLNNPLQNIRNANNSSTEEYRNITEYWYSRILNHDAQKRLREMFYSKGGFYSALAELTVHELICLQKYSSIEYHVGTNEKNEKNVDFRINGGTSEECYVEVGHIDPYPTETSSNGEIVQKVECLSKAISKIKHCLSAKCSQNYGLENKPYVIAVDCQRGGTQLIHFAEALYGAGTHDLHARQDGSRELGEMYLKGDGYFYPRVLDGEQRAWDDEYDKNLDGVLAFCGIEPSQLHLTEVAFFPNPASTSYARKVFPKIPRIKVNNGKMEIKGITLDKLLKS